MNAQAGSRVGIIGAGRLGQAMSRAAIRAGRSVVIANSRGPEALTSMFCGGPICSRMPGGPRCR